MNRNGLASADRNESVEHSNEKDTQLLTPQSSQVTIAQPQSSLGNPVAIQQFQPGSLLQEGLGPPMKIGAHSSVHMVCPHCGSLIASQVKHRHKYDICFYAWILALTPCLLCWVPCMMKSCRYARHMCPECSHVVATARPIGGKCCCLVPNKICTCLTWCCCCQCDFWDWRQ